MTLMDVENSSWEEGARKKRVGAKEKKKPLLRLCDDDVTDVGTS